MIRLVRGWYEESDRREDRGKKIDYPIPVLSLESFNLLRIYVLEIIHTLMELVLNVHSKLPTML